MLLVVSSYGFHVSSYPEESAGDISKFTSLSCRHVHIMHEDIVYQQKLSKFENIKSNSYAKELRIFT